MIQFYSPEIETTGRLPEEESGHCVRVLRMKTGDELWATDGKGHRFKCRIEKADPKATTFTILEKEDLPREREFKLTLAVAPTKNADRMEWLVEKAVEIGTDRIVLLKCARSERKVLRTDRLRKVMVAAMKQSLSGFLPELSEVIDFKEFLKEEGKGEEKYFGYCSPDYPRKEFAKEYQAGKDVVIMIGPEGDFTEEEVEMAVKTGYQPVTFGKKRLRTETAGVFAISAVNTINRQNAD